MTHPSDPSKSMLNSILNGTVSHPSDSASSDGGDHVLPLMSHPLVADANVPRADTGVRRLVQVAVGILVRADGKFLLTSRPHGKVYAGYWEFPGGKLEAGETVEAALRRELIEELGLTIGCVEQWREETVDYPHALVRLHFCWVRDWTGDLQMREQQSFSWENLPVSVAPILPGALPVLAWMAAGESQS